MTKYHHFSPRSIYQQEEIIGHKYRINNVLGQGGVAITYGAVDLTTESPVAIKVISLKQLDNWKQIELFRREAEVLAKLDHPAIPQYIDYFDLETDNDKAFYIVQQQTPGKSLSDLVESGWRTTEAEVKNIAQQVLEILIYLHSLDPRVIHRDIKPSNLIRSDDGTIYLVDFGAVQNTYYNTLMPGSTVVGTYGYMAPEQFRGQALPATDLYSLGATLLYLLTHRSPAELPQDTLKLDFRNSVDISEGFAEWLDKILEPDLDDRFTDANVALAQLFFSKRKKQRKLITSISGAFLAIGLVAGLNSHKWFFLSHLGYYPKNICSSQVLSQFFEQGGILDNVNTKDQICILSNSIKHDDLENIKNKFNRLENISIIVDQLNANNRTLFHEAVIRGEYKILEFLLEYDVDIKLKVNSTDINTRKILDRNIERLLFRAISKNNYEIVEALIYLGLDVNVELWRSQSLFYHLVSNGNQKLVKILIDKGANVNAKNKYSSRTPLFEAIDKENIEIAQLLIDNQADINAQDSNGKTPLFYINSIDTAKFCIKNQANLNIKSNDGKTALFYNLKKENIDIAKLLIENGADIQTKDNHGRTLLFDATSIDIAKLLIENGVNVQTKDNYGNSALFNAASVDIAQLLIENGADILIKNRDGETPLFNIVNKGTKEVAEFLIKQGADVNTRSSISGRTPLFKASSVDIAKLLIKNGADVNAINYFHSTPLFSAISRNNQDVARLLIEYGADVNAVQKFDGETPLFYAARGNKNITELLIKHGAEINIRDKDGQTPLFNSVFRSKKIPELLIKYGADINIQDKNSRTPLFYAAYWKNTDVAKLLIEHGADINIQLDNGETLLHIALANSDEELTALLIQHGADTTIVNFETMNRLYNLSREEYQKLSKFLEKHQNMQ